MPVAKSPVVVIVSAVLITVTSPLELPDPPDPPMETPASAELPVLPDP